MKDDLGFHYLTLACDTLWEPRFSVSATLLCSSPQLVQFLTGHGNFRAKLNGFRLVNSPECGWRDVYEPVERVLW